MLIAHCAQASVSALLAQELMDKRIPKQIIFGILDRLSKAVATISIRIKGNGQPINRSYNIFK